MFYSKRKMKRIERTIYIYNKENFYLRQKINKVLDFIDTWERFRKRHKSPDVSMLDLLYIKEILGDEENGRNDKTS